MAQTPSGSGNGTAPLEAGRVTFLWLTRWPCRLAKECDGEAYDAHDVQQVRLPSYVIVRCHRACKAKDYHPRYKKHQVVGNKTSQVDQANGEECHNRKRGYRPVAAYAGHHS